ncbi:unnamed protein product [Aphanomyces euteiches]
METLKGVVAKLDKKLQGASKPSDDVVSSATGRLIDVELHDYQLEGLKWLAHRESAKLNVILGDEMGLGKTLQTIAFICFLDEIHKHAFKSSLIVAPLSVLPNWKEQLHRFAPHLSVAFKNAPTRILLASYELVLLDISFFKATHWSIGVFDEGHRLKNAKAKIHQTLSNEIQFERKMLLTGTPIQNNMEELSALLSFLNPALFTPAVCQAFQSTTMSPTFLRSILSPLLLLRTVKDVEHTLKLPPLSKVVIHAEMSAMQRAYYKEVVSKGTAFQSNLSFQNILVQLRKACNHPYLFPNAEPEPFQEGPHLYMNSGKLFVLHQILAELKAQKHTILLFSTSTAFLDIIQDYCTWQYYSYERLDGSVRGEERWQTIDRFRNEDTFLFLVSTRAGGVGLNLQRADTVIFCDVDYNPQMELQALARAYRMGQTQPIHVIHLVCAHSVEEIIYKRSLSKLKLSKTVIEASKANIDNDDESPEDMLQYGLHHLMEQSEDTELEPLTPDQLETILSRGQTSTPVVASGIEDAVQDENMYYFEGHDYSKQDAQSLKKLKAESKSAPSKLRRSNKAIAKYEDDSNDEEEPPNQEEIERKRKARKEALWLKNNYTSYVVSTEEAAEDEQVIIIDDDDEEIISLEYKSGNAALVKPLSPSEPVIIVHCVDTSGRWTPRGFFGAISHRSTIPEQVYAQAKTNQDLKLGQAHCIPIADNTLVHSMPPSTCLVLVLELLASIGMLSSD